LDRVDAMVFHRHAGPSQLVDTTSNVPSIMKEIRKHLVQNSNLLALDMEWVPDRSKHQNNPVALLQLAIGETVWLFRTCDINLPKDLREILVDRSVTKFVVSFDSADRKKMQTSWGFQDVQGLVDISVVAKKRCGIEGCGLKKLAQRYGLCIEKDREVSISNWAAKELSARQLQYACDDAFFTLWVARGLLREAPGEAPHVLEALESCWQRINSAVAMEDTEEKDRALASLMADLHAALLVKGPVPLGKLGGLNDSRGVPFRDRARVLEIRLSKDFLKEQKGYFKVNGETVRARTAFEVAPFESAELEVCWTADDALQRWQEICGASRPGVTDLEWKGRLALLRIELQRLMRQEEGRCIDRLLTAPQRPAAAAVAPVAPPWTLPEAALSEEQLYDSQRTVFARELPRSLEISELKTKIRQQLSELSLEKVALFRPKKGNQNRGYGFLVFERMADAQMALAKEIYIDGHLAKMHPYTPPGRRKVAA